MPSNSNVYIPAPIRNRASEQKCHTKMREAAGQYPKMGITLAFFAVVALAVLEDSVANHSSGQFVDGAKSTYDDGRLLGLQAFNHSTSQNYSLFTLSNSDYANPFDIDVSAFQSHIVNEGSCATMMGLAMAFFLMSYLSKQTIVSCYPKITNGIIAAASALTTVGVTVYYAATGGFTEMAQTCKDLFAQGQTLGISTYGFADGQNSYCSQMNYNGTCPDPSEYYTLLQNADTSHRITPLYDNMRFLMIILAFMVISPLASSCMFGMKKVYQYARGQTMFGDDDKAESLIGSGNSVHMEHFRARLTAGLGLGLSRSDE